MLLQNNRDFKLNNEGEKWMNHLKYSGHTLQKKELIFCNVSTQPRIKINNNRQTQFYDIFDHCIRLSVTVFNKRNESCSNLKPIFYCKY